MKLFREISGGCVAPTGSWSLEIPEMEFLRRLLEKKAGRMPALPTAAQDIGEEVPFFVAPASCRRFGLQFGCGNHSLSRQASALGS